MELIKLRYGFNYIAARVDEKDINAENWSGSNNIANVTKRKSSMVSNVGNVNDFSKKRHATAL